jgi:hypothetical protein
MTLRHTGKYSTTQERSGADFCTRHDELAALVSYTENQSSSRSQHHSFAIVIFSTDSSSDIPVISRMIPVSHTSVRTLHPS